MVTSMTALVSTTLDAATTTRCASQSSLSESIRFIGQDVIPEWEVTRVLTSAGSAGGGARRTQTVTLMGGDQQSLPEALAVLCPANPSR